MPKHHISTPVPSVTILASAESSSLSFSILMRILGVMSILLAAGCVNPRAQEATAQALNDAANELNGLRQDLGQLQMDLDSLKQVVARQDSAIAKLTALVPK